MTMQACDRCRTRKTRCDRRFPQCGACDKARTPCLHADKLRQRNLPRGYIDSLESQVQALKAQNKSLQDELSRSLLARDSLLPESSSASTDTASSTSSSRSTQLDSPSEGGSTPNTFVNEVGYLSLVAIGETRYLGSSSGLGLADIIEKILNVQGGLDPFSAPAHGDSYSVRNRIPVVPLETPFPSIIVAKTFTEAYFQHTHIAFPLLHRPSFLGSVEKIYTVPDYYDSNPFEAFVFDMVLAIGSSTLNRFDDSSGGSWTHYVRAQSKIAAITNLPGLQSLKVILLLAQHGIFSNLRDTAASIWHLVGIGARICFELGLHLERKGVGQSIDPNSVSYKDEMKKRCFWCLYNLDRIVSSTLGRPFSIRDDEIDVSLPSHLDDDCFGPDRTTNLSSEGGISPFLHIIRIRRISGEILQLFYNSTAKRGGKTEEKLQTRRKFHDDIDAWKADTARLRLVPITDSDKHVSSYLTQEWYDAAYNNTVLLLYRPSPYLPQPFMTSTSVNEEPDLLMLLASAKVSIESYTKMHRNRMLNCSWITLHGIFIAGLAYVYSVSSILRNQAMQHTLPSALSIMETCRQCSNLLVAISERWDSTRQTRDLFDRISTFMIKDVLNAPCGAERGARSSTSDPCQEQLSTASPTTLRLQSEGESSWSVDRRSRAIKSTTGSPTAITRLEEILALVDSAYFPDAINFSGRESLPHINPTPVWPFEDLVAIG